MIKTVAIPALVAILAAGVAADASAWERKGSFTGPRGTSTVDGSGSCSGGACTRDVTKTGPFGYSASRQGSRSCSGGPHHHGPPRAEPDAPGLDQPLT
jgi:hypothetical protein